MSEAPLFSHIHFQTLVVTDIDRALAFYTEVMDFAVERNEAYGDSRWIFLQIPGAETLLHFDVQPAIPEHDTPRLILVTEDVDAACEVLEDRGVTIKSGPDDAEWEPGTRWALFDDSEGNLVLIQTMR